METKAQQVSKVDENLIRLSGTINELYNIIQELEKRLSPVMEPVKAEVGIAVDKAGPTSELISSKIYSQTERVGQLTNVVATILKRLEV